MTLIQVKDLYNKLPRWNCPIVFVMVVSHEVLASGHGTSVLGHVEAGRGPRISGATPELLLGCPAGTGCNWGYFTPI